jgi:hypothetical protein
MFKKLIKKIIKFLGEKKKDFEDVIVDCLPKILHRLVKKHNKLKLDDKKMLLPVLYASFRPGFSVHMAVEYLKERGHETHSSKYIIDRIKQIDIDVLQNICDKCRGFIFKILNGIGFKKRKCLIAIDYHEKPFYGDKKTREVVGCKRKAGTNYAYKYITASIVEEGIRFNLGCLPVTQFDLEEDLLRKLIGECRKHVVIGTVLLDRGFNGVDDYHLLEEELRLKFIMPQTKNSKLKKMLESGELKVCSQFEYTFNEHRSKEYHYKVRMFYITNEKGEKYAFVTNIHTTDEELLKLIVQAYDKRWGIETGYRVKHDFLCKTTSKSFTVRTFFAQLAFLLQDFWTLKNYIAHKEKGTHEPRAKDINKSKGIKTFLRATSKKLKLNWKPITKALIFCDICCDIIKQKIPKAKLT